jgi:hypothetical protein
MRRRIFALALAIGLALGLLALGMEAASASQTAKNVSAGTAIYYGSGGGTTWG